MSKEQQIQNLKVQIVSLHARLLAAMDLQVTYPGVYQDQVASLEQQRNTKIAELNALLQS